MTFIPTRGITEAPVAHSVDPSADTLRLEWLAANRSGSFAMGCVDRVPRRKYHGLLTVRDARRGEPLHLLAEMGESAVVGAAAYVLHSFEFDGAVDPAGYRHLARFRFRPHPEWRYAFGEHTLERALAFDDGDEGVHVRYALEGPCPVTLYLTPFVTFRGYHGESRENLALRGAVEREGDAFMLRPYPELPPLLLRFRGAPVRYEPAGRWTRNVLHRWEGDRGYAAHEDYFAPGAFKVELAPGEPLAFTAGLHGETPSLRPRPRRAARTLRAALEEAARPFAIVRGDGMHSVVAGYPWFGEWGRDSMISAPGLALGERGAAFARKLLGDYAAHRGGGLIPNVLAAAGHPANLNSADATLLFAWAADRVAGTEALGATTGALLDALRGGADPRIAVTGDGALWMAPGPHALTWMDALAGGAPVTPRHGRRIETDAPLLLAMERAAAAARRAGDGAWLGRWAPLLERARSRFHADYWLEEEGWYADGIDAAGRDARLRPNQLFALALAETNLPPPAAERALDAVRRHLLTPLGLRTLAPFDPAYRGRYAGSQEERDRAYHQGTVWPWLLGVYADAVARVHGEARCREELAPVLERIAHHMDHEACLGQISEVFDGDWPHAAGGAPAQAWSVAEVLRVTERFR